MIYSKELENMCHVAKGVDHGPAPIPEEGKWVKAKEIKVSFGDVKVGFENIEKPHIFMKANDGLENDTIIKNYTILEGYNQEYKVCDEDSASSIVYNAVEQKKLPRTGF